MPVTKMVHVCGTSVNLLAAYRSHFCQPTVLFTRHITFLTAGRKWTSYSDAYSAHSKFCCPCKRLTSLVVKCRPRSNSTVNDTDHFVELGMPRCEDDVRRMAENVTARNMNVNTGDLVRIFCSQIFFDLIARFGYKN